MKRFKNQMPSSMAKKQKSFFVIKALHNCLLLFFLLQKARPDLSAQPCHNTHKVASDKKLYTFQRKVVNVCINHPFLTIGLPQRI